MVSPGRRGPGRSRVQYKCYDLLRVFECEVHYKLVLRQQSWLSTEMAACPAFVGQAFLKK